MVRSSSVTHVWKGIDEHIPTKKNSRRSDEKWPHSRSPCFIRLTCILHAVFDIIGLSSSVGAHARDAVIVRGGAARVIWMRIASLVVVADSTVNINLWVGARAPTPQLHQKSLESKTVRRHVQKNFN